MKVDHDKGRDVELRKVSEKLGNWLRDEDEEDDEEVDIVGDDEVDKDPLDNLLSGILS